MNRERALEISEVLVERGITHTITVGVHDSHMPRERYTVLVTPVLTFTPVNITSLQRIADSLNCGIAFIDGSFVFVGTGLG